MRRVGLRGFAPGPTAVRKVFGSAALIQRCPASPPTEGRLTDNVADHLPEAERELIDRKLVRAFTHPDPALGLRAPASSSPPSSAGTRRRRPASGRA